MSVPDGEDRLYLRIEISVSTKINLIEGYIRQRTFKEKKRQIKLEIKSVILQRDSIGH